jgi:hypothetical protein
MTLLVPTQRCNWHHWCHLSGVIGTTNAASAMSLTAGATSAVSLTPPVRYDTADAGDLEFERLWLPLKVISIKKIHRQIVLPYPITIKKLFWLKRCHWHRWCQNKRFNSRLSSRIRSHMQKGLNPLIRGPGGIVWWNNQRSKISWHCPFKEKMCLSKCLLTMTIQYLLAKQI